MDIEKSPILEIISENGDSLQNRISDVLLVIYGSFQTRVLIPYSLKTSENLMLSYILRGYEMDLENEFRVNMYVFVSFYLF